MMPVGIGGEVVWWCPSLDDDGSGTTNVTDLSGNGHDGTIVDGEGDEWIADTDAGGVRALQFQNAAEYVSRADDAGLSITGALTISAWVWRPNAAGATNKGILAKYVLSGNLRSYGSFCNDSWRPGMALSSSGAFESDNSLIASTVLDPETWYHLLWQFSPSNFQRIYINGSLAAAKTSGVIAALYDSPADLWGGMQGSVSSVNHWTGRLDDMRIFDRVLAMDEITALASMRGYQSAGTTVRRNRSIQTGGRLANCKIKTGGQL